MDDQDQGLMFSQALGYERFMGRWSRLLAARFVEFVRLPSGARVLDVGSGTGNLAFAIAQSDPQAEVIGIDPSPAFVAYAGRHVVPRTHFQVGDAQQLAFPDDSFDGCTALLALNFIADQGAALLEMRRVAKTGAVIAAAVWDHADGMQMLRIFWEVADALDPTPRPVEEPQPLLGRTSLAALWSRSGLREVALAALTFEMNFTSFQDYWEPFELGQGPAGAYLASADRSVRDAIARALRSRLLRAGADGPFTLSARAWAVRGTK